MYASIDELIINATFNKDKKPTASVDRSRL